MSHPTRRQVLKTAAGLASAAALANSAFAAPSVFPKHEPLGHGIGFHPGRVAWAWDPTAASWDGKGFWWEKRNFSDSTITRLIREGLCALTGAKDEKAAWEALFTFCNRSHDRGSRSWQPGETIAIKVNMNGTGEIGGSEDGETNLPYANTVLLKLFLQTLVTQGGVTPADIIVYDAGRVFPDFMMRECQSGVLHGVRFIYRHPGYQDDAAATATVPCKWSGPIKGLPCFLPQCVVQCSYLINLANLKGHSFGLTLCGKNHFGSFVNAKNTGAPRAAGVHQNVWAAKHGDWSVLTDLMANRYLGGKTMLCILDALLTAPSEMGAMEPEETLWEQPPFLGRTSSSLFFSQDPVAIDSVGADFLMNEPNITSRNESLAGNDGVENYLHEAALLPHPPSGHTYSDGYGGPVQSLGVHDHWDNVQDKNYGRNLGKPEGIELVRTGPGFLKS